MTNLSDRRWVRRILSGDSRAGERLITEYYAPVFRLLRSLTHDEETAQDLTQQTFIRAWKGLDGYRGEARLNTWLCRIAHHEYANWLRSRKPVTGLDAAERLQAPPDPGGLSAMMVEAAMRRLSDPLREAFVLCCVLEYTDREAGDILGVPRGTVKSRLHEARKQLRIALECLVCDDERPAGAEDPVAVSTSPVCEERNDVCVAMDEESGWKRPRS